MMSKTKLLAGFLLIFALLAVQVGIAAAAPVAQDTTPITGTIQSINTETDENGVTTVLVTLLLEDQVTTQTVRLSAETAADLGLFDLTTQEPILDLVGQPITIDSSTVIPDEEPAEESVHPIAALLGAFFGEEASIIDGYHEDGFGFGVIAQALWMSHNLNGDTSTAELILDAKQSGDYSAFTLPDGSSPSNWGQFKKAVLEKKNNLGVVVSGQADPLTEEQTQEKNGNGHNKEKHKNKDKGNKNK
jgi:hypothetical protein